MKAMTIDEATNSLVDIGRTIKIKTEGDERNYIALEMAINALQRTQRVETLEKAEEGAPKPEGKKKEDITISDLDIMTELAEKKQVEIELTITPDQQQVVARPWKPLEWQTSYKTKDA